MILEIIKNIWITALSIIGFVSFFYLHKKILFAEKELNEINKLLEESKSKLDNIELSNLNKGGVDIVKDPKEFKLKKTIEKLERQKKYTLERISLFKIYKK